MMPWSFVLVQAYLELFPLLLALGIFYALVVLSGHVLDAAKRLLRLWWKGRGSGRPWGGWPR